MTVMLTEKDEHSLVEDVDVSELRFVSGLTLEMGDVQWQVPVLPTPFQQAITKVNVFAIHKKALVQ